VAVVRPTLEESSPDPATVDSGQRLTDSRCWSRIKVVIPFYTPGTSPSAPPGPQRPTV